ncbi:MAG: 3-oxoadipate enol-lactonase [Cognatishimia sp.]
MKVMRSFKQCNGKILHYSFRKGTSAMPIVFANSLGTDLRIWDDVIAALPQDITVLAYDKSGHGLSETGSSSIAEHANDLAALMSALDISDALVCGVSVGGMIAQSLAAHYPTHVRGLVLSNTAYRIGDAETWNTRIAGLEADGLEAMAAAVMERWFSKDFLESQPELVAGYEIMLARTPQTGYRKVCEAIRDADLLTDVQNINCPALCIAGGADLSTAPALVKTLADALPNARYECLETVGHLPCIEDPDSVATAIRTFHGSLL